MKKNIISYFSIVLSIFVSILIFVFFFQQNQVSIIQRESLSADMNYVLKPEPEDVVIDDVRSNSEKYDDMTIEELENALYTGTLPLEYSAFYTYSDNRLSLSKGALYFNGHKETYYSEKVLPGETLNIPGRHVADDGTIRDGDGYICVAANSSYLEKYSILITSVGPAKVYDSGCDYGTIDIYTSW